MKATLKTKELSAALNIVSRCIAAKTTLPILTCVKVETVPGAILLTTTANLERCVTQRVAAKITGKGGAFVCQLSRLKDAIANSDAEDVEISHKDNVLTTKTIEAAPKSGKYLTLDITEFPELPEAGEGSPVSTDRFKSALERALTAVDDFSPSVQVMKDNGVIRLVGINRNSASINDFESIIWDQCDGLLPADAVADVIAFMPDDSEVRFHIGARLFSFSTDTLTYVARLYDGQFPPWKKVADHPAGMIEFGINRTAFLSHLAKATSVGLSTGSVPAIDWVADGKRITASSMSDADEVRVEFDQVSEPHEMRFDPTKCIRLLRPWKADEIRVFVPPTIGSIFFECGDSKAILQTMRKL